MSGCGRARGRACGGTSEPGEQAVRPGGPPPPETPSQVVQQQQKAAMPGNGRAAHRRGPRGEPRPGGGGGPPTEQMGGMSLGGGGGGPSGERGHRRGGLVVQEPHTRPHHITDKKGTAGSAIQLITNCFKLETKPDWTMYQYHVEYNPDVQNKGMRNKMLKEHNELLGYPKAFDGMILFLPHRLPDDVIEVYSKLPSDDTTNVRITFKLTNELPPTSYTTIQMYNVIFRRVLKMIEMKLIGRDYFNPELGVTIPQHKLEVWPGFVTSILKYESSVMLMADIKHKILRINSVLDIMYDLYNNTRQQDFHANCTKKLVGEIVLTKYNNKTYRIDDLDWDKNPNSTFKTQDGSEVKFIDYYQKHHNITVTDMEQPLLLSRPKKRDLRRGMEGDFYLLPELCTLTGLSDEVRADFHVMKDIAVHTRIPPDDRRKTLQGFIDQINQNTEVAKEMGGWGLRFAEKLLQLQGRVLPPEKIHQQKGSFNYKPSEADWSREMRGQQLISCVPLRNWLLIVTQRDIPKANDFVDTMMRVGPPMGIQVIKPQIIQLPQDNTQAFLRALKDQVNPQVQLALCLLPSNRKDTYDAIKKFCCIEHPVPSQVVLGRTLMKKQMLMSVCTKIAIQLNCKLGGEVWALDIPLNGLMICGIDTYHDSSSKGRSVAGLVCSLNKTATRYYSRVCFQHTHQELVSAIMPNLIAALKKYHEINGSLPERVIIYRDGVGDGQLPAVLEHEIPQLIQCFKEVGQDYQPKLAVIVVKKRINIRFFAQSGPGLSNPPPGTCIDSEVTRPEWYDFFLVSQAVRQGTVTPTHYNVVYDTSGMKPDHMQRLTYKLCHLYYNWPGTVRVPAPCQYAHKLAFLVGQSLHKDPDLALSDKLFFL